ncbi:diguanylate cyclase domain-containing protein [Collimonas pratensis]|uniref:diguanylate cyclase n=1 Tax=Collimonas pratensis TaxID=279113 RepID=A0A127QWQ1_9BURK|nr:diguanylate cyclase [Collimonas pratensis]AMP05426.1 response regulator [Collimonas pratensis]AMP14548.1 response regulator [Collimonas pratensis]NKI69212.1 diguanylate cyclase [Collimonas pratensis]
MHKELNLDIDQPPDDYPVMVLLVDDQAMVGEAVRRALANQINIDFHYCAHPDEAIEAAQKTRPTVILQDLVMPGIDGLTLVRQYRANPATRNVPIIVLSTREDPAVKSAAFTAGANDYLVKLPDTIELVARIRYHSRSYVNLLQRDEAYRALRQSQQQLLETNLELQRLTNSDGLTGLANRRYFDEYFSAEWKRAEREQSPLSLLMIDVDDFKLYNDTYGHLAGDTALKQVAESIGGFARRPTDLAARIGGEEFVLVLPSMSREHMETQADKLQAAVHALGIAHATSNNDARVTISIGGASIVPLRGSSQEKLVEAADQALYRAKRGGKNRVEIAQE